MGNGSLELLSSVCNIRKLLSLEELNWPQAVCSKFTVPHMSTSGQGKQAKCLPAHTPSCPERAAETLPQYLPCLFLLGFLSTSHPRPAHVLYPLWKLQGPLGHSGSSSFQLSTHCTAYLAPKYIQDYFLTFKKLFASKWITSTLQAGINYIYLPHI